MAGISPSPISATGGHERSFRRVGTFANYLNNPATPAAETVSQIVAATTDGKTLVYTDAVRGTIGFIDISIPSVPQPGGALALDPDPSDDVDYRPTSVDVLGSRLALVAANTSASLTDTSGVLMVIDISTRTIVREIALGGQPDSIKVSDDGHYTAIVVENERNEDLCVGGTADGTEADAADCSARGGILGALPQTPYGNPAGYLAVL
jgi:hypothetical protein